MAAGRVGADFEKEKLQSEVQSPPSYWNHPEQLEEEDQSRSLPKARARMWLNCTRETGGSCPKIYLKWHQLQRLNIYTQTQTDKTTQRCSAFIIHWLTASGLLWVRPLFSDDLRWRKVSASTFFQAPADKPAVTWWCMEEVALMWLTV